ncbi:3-isopropylmalate dehydratase large subunit [Paraburkholderia monticola]|uniref:3-isopropylmalate dehydratase large subunit n=1 Tax=Paraburkholderia monticola TaxID=1399968 RepID=A0A149PFX7_9BURK|nr:aconitase/3-isopropylmalate dehydratase large subunit family protein [Paraburkholderia monticola]KXU83949.1 3-isopropylmalate dehydratase large subunit [Paraburkholderia monticola]
MSGKTLSEKILSAKAGRDVRAGDVVICEVDYALGTDGSIPMAIDYFAAMDGARVHAPHKLLFALDHYAPAPSPKAALLQAGIRRFAKEQGIRLFDIGEGIGHQLVVEQGFAAPGRLLVGADSHSVMYGAANCFATGIGSSDLAGVMKTGKVWLKVPASIRVNLHGRLGQGVYPKDLALYLAQLLGNDGATYETLEFGGDGVQSLDFEDRLVVANMSVEFGAKNAIFPYDEACRCYLEGRADDLSGAVSADPDAIYSRTLDIDLATLEPFVAVPHAVSNNVRVGSLETTSVQMVFLGTCTGGRTKDFRQALNVFREFGAPAEGVQLVVTPASREVLLELTRGGELAELISLGAVIVTPGCGACCGTSGAIPEDGANVISTANRNFKGRMGNPSAQIFLASPEVCAASAIAGRIASPRMLAAGDH